MSHPFVERLIGSIRHELLDHTLFWTATALDNKLHDYQCYYTKYRAHSGQDGATPIKSANKKLSTSMNIHGRSTTLDCLNCLLLPELPFRQGQVQRCDKNVTGTIENANNLVFYRDRRK
jgi:hypothetical protein